MNFIQKIKGQRDSIPARPPLTMILFAWLGGFIAISSLALLKESLSMALVLGSFGATCVLAFGFPDAPFSQPRNIVIGHAMSSGIALICLHFLGNEWWSMGIALGSAIALMMWTRTVHPPAGSNPVIVFLTQPDWSFLLFPTLSGAVVLVVIALVYNNLTRKTSYPKYW